MYEIKLLRKRIKNIKRVWKRKEKKRKEKKNQEL